MNVGPTSSPPPEAPTPIALFPMATAPRATPAAELPTSGGARRLSRWEELEEIWLPEERDLSHSGINE
ncbi:MAG: hypothetical protein B9S33_22665 [Pedosphaera sp. Tous-C6FEB]|nr:MAG: hypothetical protein B9S33_22665 [Pedosphaera sp. Tous-C6FEB]